MFTYGLPEATTDGEAHLQLIVYGADGQQQWYSAVGFMPGSGTGTVEILEQEGDTVIATGTLQKSGSDPEELADFSLQATCPPELIDDVIMGNVSQTGEQAYNVGRNAALAAGFPESLPGVTIDRQCGSLPW